MRGVRSPTCIFLKYLKDFFKNWCYLNKKFQITITFKCWLFSAIQYRILKTLYSSFYNGVGTGEDIKRKDLTLSLGGVRQRIWTSYLFNTSHSQRHCRAYHNSLPRLRLGSRTELSNYRPIDILARREKRGKASHVTNTVRPRTESVTVLAMTSLEADQQFYSTKLSNS